MEDIEKIRKIIEPIIRNEGLELFDVIIQKEKGQRFLRIFIDNLEREIKISDCETISNLVSYALDNENIISQHYNLEVSSPGLNRPLRNINDFIRFKGRLVKIILNSTIDLDHIVKNFTGRIKDVDSNCIIMEDNKGKIVNIQYDQIAKARLEVEM